MHSEGTAGFDPGPANERRLPVSILPGHPRPPFLQVVAAMLVRFWRSGMSVSQLVSLLVAGASALIVKPIGFESAMSGLVVLAALIVFWSWFRAECDAMAVAGSAGDGGSRPAGDGV